MRAGDSYKIRGALARGESIESIEKMMARQYPPGEVKAFIESLPEMQKKEAPKKKAAAKKSK